MVRATKNQFVYTLDKSTKMIVVVDMTKVNKKMTGCKKKLLSRSAVNPIRKIENANISKPYKLVS